jgi:hypothetical protein
MLMVISYVTTVVNHIALNSAKTRLTRLNRTQDLTCEPVTNAAKVSGLKLHLKDEARELLRDQKTDDWKGLKEQFISEFGGSKKMTRDSLSRLIHFKQRNQENLMNYTQRFKKLVR